MDESAIPVIAMVQISSDKNVHNYYHAKWTGSEWRKTFIANGGGHVIQTSGLELCYSGGMTIDASDSNWIYCSVPVDGAHGNGNIYEIIKFTISSDGDTVTVTNTSITRDSSKNNARPYSIPNTENRELKLMR
jgi:hypothetical protein